MDTPAATLGQTDRKSRPAASTGAAFGSSREHFDNRFVYAVISSRARGLSVGVNMNPDQACNFDCAYCEVDRARPSREARLDVPAMSLELERTLALIHSGDIRQRRCYREAPPELLELRHVALSGDGEPTLCPNFAEALEAVIHLRARGRFPRFKVVLMTNARGFDRQEVGEALRLLTSNDEIWAKLEAGTQAYANRINRPDCSLESILANILIVARERPVVIQSLFPSVEGAGPPPSEIEAYAQRLLELNEAGARIPLVQIYSATRPAASSGYGHLPLKTLSTIARRVREVTGLKAEVF